MGIRVACSEVVDKLDAHVAMRVNYSRLYQIIVAAREKVGL